MASRRFFPRWSTSSRRKATSPPDADDVLTDGMSELEAALRQARTA